MRGVRAYVEKQDAQAALACFEQAAQEDRNDTHVAAHWCAAMILLSAGVHEQAIPHLEAIVAGEMDPAEDLALMKYMIAAPGLVSPVKSCDLGPLSPSSVAGPTDAVIALAGCYAKVGRLDEGIGVLQKALEHRYWPLGALALVALYQEDQDWDEIIHLAATYATEDPDEITSPLLRLHQAGAMLNLGQPDAAIEVYSAMLRRRKLDADLAKAARYGRGLAELAGDKTAAAKRDFARIYADDPDYIDVAKRVSPDADAPAGDEQVEP